MYFIHIYQVIHMLVLSLELNAGAGTPMISMDHFPKRNVTYRARRIQP